ncbi:MULTISPECIES: class I SAM-dependent methyltransferase [unclassified Streptomyces]|uniref:class I SAM-dependent methyltransferase n=1 Tax=unclassified Streptomyces TaxID=2593676 RepID=UPI002DDAF583|nr:class I SAM-dependent methyltransferase [Streptomyces sp. NBC_01237]WRZ70605.1 class I SAM-dependent methyltransferase [Streptomyces sp. NBC_01237]
MNTTETSTVHADRNHAGADAATIAMVDMLELDAEVLGTCVSELTAWLDELTDREPRRIVDLGSGTGTGAIALAHRFARAGVTAVDLSPQMLHRLAEKAYALGLSDRVIGVRADLNDGWPALGTIDLVWAAASLHHMAEPDRVLAGAFDALRPGGLLALTEMDFFPRFLPDDIGVGRPGLEARIHAALSPAPAVDWTDQLARTGFVLEARRPFSVDLAAPLPPAAARYAEVCLRKLRSHLDEQLPVEDLATLDALLDSEGPHSVLRRDDLTVRTTRTTWAARRP